ncbi:hypothetical protein C8F04DRAFT_1403178 [Mycena alexandri]|uniref:Uncharacterized protein n=1 Tax=Mycena alexandri TaxID=1745969 RepID=A0AAD6S614_9AGAR|nr:hypothetical protein C8F04DRAFT_1403178 [Mycena alexandri]
MQCKFLLASVVSCLMLSVAAAPIAVAELTTTPENLARSPLPVRSIFHVLTRFLPSHLAFFLQEPVEIARTPEPKPGCKMYACICYATATTLTQPTLHSPQSYLIRAPLETIYSIILVTRLLTRGCAYCIPT